MRDPHRLFRTVLYALTPAGYAIAIAWHLGKAIRDIGWRKTR